MKKIILIFSFLAFAMSTSSTFAADGATYTGMVQPYFYGGRLYLRPINPQITRVRPECATRELLRLEVSDLNSARFKYEYSILLSAWMAGREVTLEGTGQCTSEGDELIFVVRPK